MDRTQELHAIAARFRTLDEETRHREGVAPLTPRDTADGWRLDSIVFQDVEEFKTLATRAALAARLYRQGWEAWLAELTRQQARLLAVPDSGWEYDLAEPRGVYDVSIRGVCRLSARLCDLLADEAALEPASAAPTVTQARLPSDAWCEICTACEMWASRTAARRPESFQFDLDEGRAALQRGGVPPATPTWGLENGDEAEQTEFRRLATQAAVLRALADAPTWIDWLDYMHARAITQIDVWPLTVVVIPRDGPRQIRYEAPRYRRLRAFRSINQADGQYRAIDEAWRLFALCAAECEEEALRLERAAAIRVAAPPVEAPAAGPAATTPAALPHPRRRKNTSALPERLRYYRKQAGYATQASLAEACRVDDNTVGKWERGEQTPEGENRAFLIDALNAKLPTPIDWTHLEPPPAPR
jgi:DNA-binding XRE family transcriptional regulator